MVGKEDEYIFLSEDILIESSWSDLERKKMGKRQRGKGSEVFWGLEHRGITDSLNSVDYSRSMRRVFWKFGKSHAGFTLSGCGFQCIFWNNFCIKLRVLRYSGYLSCFNSLVFIPNLCTLVSRHMKAIWHLVCDLTSSRRVISISPPYWT